VELGEGLAEIVVPWSAEGLAWVDLRAAGSSAAAAVRDLALAEAQPALADALAALNAEDSRWLTSKCDAWVIDREDESLDPYELDATDLAAAGAPLYGCASYLDVLMCEPVAFASFPSNEALVRTLTQSLRERPLPHARVDLVLRYARRHAQEGYGITVYATGCGRDAAAAQQAWQRALAAATHTLLNH
jgi:hypothetical protein